MQGEQESCRICLSDLETPGRSDQELQCGHKFHEKCIKEYKKASLPNTCPICREESDDLTSVERLFEDATILKLRGDFDGAFRKLSEAVDTDDNHVFAIRSLAESFAMGLGVTQNDERAAELYESAILLCGTDPMEDLRSRLGEVYKRLGRPHDAQELFCQEYNDSRHPTSAFNLALQAKEAGNLKRAEQLYIECHRKGMLVATLNLANLYKQANRMPLAESLYKKVVDEGTERMKFGIEVTPGEHLDCVSKAMLALGSVYQQKGMRDRARKMWLHCYLQVGTSNQVGTNAAQFLWDETQNLVVEHGSEDMLDKFRQELVSVRSKRVPDERFGNCGKLAVGSSEPAEALLAKWRSLEAQPDPLIKNSAVELFKLKTDELNGSKGICIGRHKDRGRFGVRLDGPKDTTLSLDSKSRVVWVKRANVLVIGPLPLSRTLFSKVTACGSYFASPRDYDIDAGIKESLYQVAQEAEKANALVSEKLRNSAEAKSNASESLTIIIIIMEYSNPSEWFDDALRELGSRKTSSGANCILDPEVFDIVLEDLYSREEELLSRGVDIKRLKSRFVITEAHQQRTVEEKIQAAKSAAKAAGMPRTQRRDLRQKKVPVHMQVHIPSPSPSSSSHQQAPQAECPGSSSPSSNQQQGSQPGCLHSSPTCLEHQESWLIKRTFIHVPEPSSLRSMSSARPRTQ